MSLRAISLSLLAVFLLTSCQQSDGTKSSAKEVKSTASQNYIPGHTDYNVKPEQAEFLYNELVKNSMSTERPSIKKVAVHNGGLSKSELKDVDAPCWADEGQYVDIEKSILHTWRHSWLDQNPSTFEKVLKSESVLKEFLPREISHNLKVTKAIRKGKWLNSKKGDLKSYFDNYKKIEDIDLVTMKVYSPRGFRDENLNMNKAVLQVRLDIRGIDKNNSRRNDRGPIAVTVEKVSNTWKIAKLEDWGVESLLSNKATFADRTIASKVTKIPQYQRLEAIRRGGYAVASGDFNDDGINDLFVGAYGPSKLLMGKKDGTFTEVKNSGLQGETLVKTAVFADFNNDGKKDLLLVRFSGFPSVETSKLRSDIVLYKNIDGNSFERAGEILGDTVLNETAMPAAVADFNNDGLLDFYIGYPGNKDFTVFGKILRRDNIKEQGVYLNKGDFKFLTKPRMVDYNNEDEQEKYKKYTRNQRIFPHSSVAFDFDQDGDVDIVVIDDRGNISPAYQNDGEGNFIQASQQIGVMNKGYGMGLAVSDIDNDGRIDMALTNVNFNAKHRVDQSCRANWDDEVFGVFDHGLKFYKGLKGGSFAEVTGQLGLDFAGEGLAGVEFLDYDNDGYQDLYVANGLWSGTDKDEDLGNLFVRSSLANEEMVIRSHRGARPQSQIMDILSGFYGSIVGKEKKSRLSLAGFQRNRLFRNNGDGTFTEVGYLEGVDSLADGYVISKSDYDNDGDLDLILRNGDPGTGDVSFEPVQVYENLNQGLSLRVKLEGTVSNRDGVGAEVRIETKNTNQVQQVIANNGTAQSETFLHFGLGGDDLVKKLVVKWPSGNVSEFKNLKPGILKIKETPKGAKIITSL